MYMRLQEPSHFCIQDVCVCGSVVPILATSQTCLLLSTMDYVQKGTIDAYASGAQQPVASIVVTSSITRRDSGISKFCDLLNAILTFCIITAASFITILACNGSHDS